MDTPGHALVGFVLKILAQKSSVKSAQTTEVILHHLISTELGAGLHLLYLLSFGVPVV